MDKLLLKSAYDRIMESSKVLVVTHNSPDGDALACLCALGEFLTIVGKPYTLYCHDQPPRSFSYLPHFSEIISNENCGIEAFESFDIIIVCDCGSLGRTMLSAELLGRSKTQKIIEFDHHLKVDTYADIEIRNDRAAASAEIIYDFIKASNVKFNKALSTAILTGIVTDTGSFLYPATSDKTIRIASEMLIYGANLPRIVNQTMKNKSLNTMKIWGKVLSSLRINKEYDMAISVLTEADISPASADEDELEGISGFLSNLKDAKVILFLREKGNGWIKGSLRTSDPEINVSRLAQILGGGGHAKASGFSLKGRLITDDAGWKAI